jgi:hypothetical protein
MTPVFTDLVHQAQKFWPKEVSESLRVSYKILSDISYE